jgi:hypothetical protein
MEIQDAIAKLSASLSLRMDKWEMDLSSAISAMGRRMASLEAATQTIHRGKSAAAKERVFHCPFTDCIWECNRCSAAVGIRFFSVAEALLTDPHCLM